MNQRDLADVVGRIWGRDHTVWKPEPTEIADRLGWLTVPEAMRARVPELEAFAGQAAADGFTSAVLCGMGGSSLAPEVFRRTYGVGTGSLDLLVLDTTHPAAIASIERDLDLEKTLFIIASKSGGTIETLSQFAYFFDKVPRGSQFVAITDAGSTLEAVARREGFRAVFTNPTDIGGRYSALSLFGLVPAALIGADLGALLDGAEEMAASCRSLGDDNAGAWLGAVMGEAALTGRDKLTLVLSEAISGLGAWVEQLVAESTGKEGRGILPVVGEDLGRPLLYGPDRLFIVVGDRLPDAAAERLQGLLTVGCPVVRLQGTGGLGAEMFRFEFATAVAGHVLGINPFDQPNVAEAKRATAEILEGGSAEEPEPGDLAALLSQVRSGDYIAIQAYLAPSVPARAALQRARMALRDRYAVATTLGFGPRYLHSTGQLHKGGPDKGIFIQVVDAEPPEDVAIPGKPYTFGELIRAQALGDLRALRALGRRVARVTLGQLTGVIEGRV